MTVLTPPPLPVEALPAEPPRAAKPARDGAESRVGVVLAFFLCAALPIFCATCYVWHRDMTAGGGGLFAGGFFYMLGVLFVYLLAVFSAIFNCWHVVGGFLAACAFACSGPVSRTSLRVMGVGYGLLSGLLLLDAANGGIGPAVQPLAWPVPRPVAAWVVPAVGVLAGAAIRWLERRRRLSV